MEHFPPGLWPDPNLFINAMPAQTEAEFTRGD
jgi:hypothetical protein